LPITYSFEEMARNAGGNSDLAKKLDKIPAGTRASLDGQVPSTVTYNDWLKGRTDSEIKDVLGATRAKLFVDGKISLSDLINDNGRPLPIAEL